MEGSSTRQRVLEDCGAESPELSRLMSRRKLKMQEAGENVPSTPHKKKHRHRKKQLYGSILKQMEFYFSDAALSKDRFLSQLVLNDPQVPLEVFLKFNKIKALTEKCSDIANALRESKLLEVSEDCTRVQRVSPLQAYDADARTVYAESIPSSANLQWLTDVFQAYGPVAYISLPKYYNTDRIKGFAFIEFEKEQDAEACLTAFSRMGCRMPSTVKAEALSSCQGLQPVPPAPPAPQAAETDPPTPALKHKADKTCSTEGEPPSKKARKKKNSDSKTDDSLEKNKAIEDDGDKNASQAIPESSATEQSEAGSELENSAPADKLEKKSKRLRKRKKKDKKKPQKDRERRIQEAALRGLQVLSKKEWKVLRNKYLNLQRQQMKALKQVLRTQHALPEHSSAPDEGMSEGVESSLAPPAPPAIAFMEGVIVHARLAEPCVDVKQLKASTKANVRVKFVDVKEGSFDVHVRLDDPEAAKQLATSGVFPSARVLSGQEEKSYWEQLHQQQCGRFSSRRKVRGRERLVRKAQQLLPPVPALHGPPPPNKHMRLDND